MNGIDDLYKVSPYHENAIIVKPREYIDTVKLSHMTGFMPYGSLTSCAKSDINDNNNKVELLCRYGRQRGGCITSTQDDRDDPDEDYQPSQIQSPDSPISQQSQPTITQSPEDSQQSCIIII